MIGYEYEFLVREGDKPLTKATFLKFHEELKQRGWKQKFDPDTKGVLGSHRGDTWIITDNGVCNMEVELPPTETISQSHERLTVLLDELQQLYRKLGASIVGVGVFPGPSDFDHTDCTEHCTASRVTAKSFIYYLVPKRRKEHHLTHLFSGIHFWLDLPHDAREITRQLFLFNRLNPFFVALFANGPIFDRVRLSQLEGRDVLWMREFRSSVTAYDLNTYAMYPREYATIFDYFDFILDMPFSFSDRDGTSFSPTDSNLTYREFFSARKTPATWGHGGTFSAQPTLADFVRLHQSTFHHARLKFFLRDGVTLQEILAAFKSKDEKTFLACFKKFCVEVRTASAQAKGELSTAPALFLGLQSNLKKAEAVAQRYSYDFLLHLYEAAERGGLNTELDGVKIAEVCKELIAVAEEGLKQRGFGEEKYLEPLKARVVKKENPAQELLKIWKRDGLAGIWKARDF